MIFTKIFNIINKALDISNENIYFCSYIPKNITPVLVSEKNDYDLINSRGCIEVINKLNLNFYIIKSNYTFNLTCLDKGNKAFVISIDKDFLESEPDGVIKIIEYIYEFIFIELSKIYVFEFNVDLMKKIFTMFSINKYFGQLNIKDFDLEGIMEEDKALYLLKEYDITQLYDDNIIYLAMKN